MWKIYKEAFDLELGALERIGDFDMTNSEVQVKVKQRYGDSVPVDEKIITPERIFKSDKLLLIGSVTKEVDND